MVLDHVQYQKNGVQNRNTIKTSQGGLWLTVPVKVNLGMAINQVELVTTDCYEKLVKTLDMNYKKSAYYSEIMPKIEQIFSRHISSLHELNLLLLKELFGFLDISTPLVESSTLNIESLKDDMVIEIINKVGDKEYLSGKGALDYMDLEKFKAHGIKVYTYDFDYTPYTQLWDKQGFVADLSALDMLFNDLPNSKDYLCNNGKIERII